MAIIHEWKCAVHGPFEGSHPICPEFGCDSESVVKEIRTPRGFKSDATKRTDAGVKRTAEVYRQSDIRSAHEGESSKAGNRSAELLWGDRGRDILQSAMSQPSSHTYRDAKGRDHVVHSGMRMAAEEAGITKRPLPVAEVTQHQSDQQMRAQLKK